MFQDDVEEELDPHERKKLKKIKAMVDSEEEEEDGKIEVSFSLFLEVWSIFLAI